MKQQTQYPILDDAQPLRRGCHSIVVMNLQEILGLSVFKIPIPPIRRFLNASNDKFEYQDDIERHQDV
jgi:hypothetical protein